MMVIFHLGQLKTAVCSRPARNKVDRVRNSRTLKSYCSENNISVFFQFLEHSVSSLYAGEPLSLHFLLFSHLPHLFFSSPSHNPSLRTGKALVSPWRSTVKYPLTSALWADVFVCVCVGVCVSLQFYINQHSSAALGFDSFTQLCLLGNTHWGESVHTGPGGCAFVYTQMWVSMCVILWAWEFTARWKRAGLFNSWDFIVLCPPYKERVTEENKCQASLKSNMV